MQMRKWHTVVALVVGVCVQLVGVGVGLGRMVVPFGIAACVLCGSGLINWGKQISCWHRGWSWPRTYKQINMSINKCGRCSKVKHLNHEITLNGNMINTRGCCVTTCLPNVQPNELVLSSATGSNLKKRRSITTDVHARTLE